jgi:hypothetical protein
MMQAVLTKATNGKGYAKPCSRLNQTVAVSGGEDCEDDNCNCGGRKGRGVVVQMVHEFLPSLV